MKMTMYLAYKFHIASYAFCNYLFDHWRQIFRIDFYFRIYFI